MVRFLKKNDLLQALFFSFSKANCEKYAYSINIPDLVDHIERSAIEKMFYNEMLPYKKEYENVPQVQALKELLMNGIAFHHAGMLPVLKVIVENMFESGLIKVLFATETFAVGINGSTRTVVMCELEKHTEEGKRFLKADEYKQMGGRAGRRGKDTIGNVLLLPAYDFPAEKDLMSVAFGDVPSIGSRFSWSYQFFLKTIQSNAIDIENFFRKSLVNTENVMILSGMLSEKHQLVSELESLDNAIASCNEDIGPLHIVEKYEGKQQVGSFKITLGKQQQQELKKAKATIEASPMLRNMSQLLKKHTELAQKLTILENKIDANTHFVDGYLEIITQILTTWNYLDENMQPTTKGIIAAKINECNPIVLTEMVTQNFFSGMTPQEIIAFVSLFTDPIRVSGGSECDGITKLSHYDGTSMLRSQIDKLKIVIGEMMKTEDQLTSSLTSGAGTSFASWKISTDYIDIALTWASGVPVSDILIMLNEYEEYEGNFVKAMLKICNIIKDIQTVCIELKKIELLPILEQTESLILRGIVFYI